MNSHERGPHPFETTMLSFDDHYLLLRPPPPAARCTGGARVVLLHGWLQDSQSWLTTATRLRDVHGHSCLLLDWLGHGRTPTHPRAMTVENLLLQLETVLARVGWDKGPKLAIAGCSLGGGVMLRFAAKHPERVARLNLVAAAGLSEPFWACPSVTWPLRAGCVMVVGLGLWSR